MPAMHGLRQGAGKQAYFKILIPATWNPVSITHNASVIKHQMHQEDASRYARFSVPASGVSSVVME